MKRIIFLPFLSLILLVCPALAKQKAAQQSDDEIRRIEEASRKYHLKYTYEEEVRSSMELLEILKKIKSKNGRLFGIILFDKLHTWDERCFNAARCTKANGSTDEYLSTHLQAKDLSEQIQQEISRVQKLQDPLTSSAIRLYALNSKHDPNEDLEEEKRLDLSLYDASIVELSYFSAIRYMTEGDYVLLHPSSVASVIEERNNSYKRFLDFVNDELGFTLDKRRQAMCKHSANQKDLAQSDALLSYSQIVEIAKARWYECPELKDACQETLRYIYARCERD